MTDAERAERDEAMRSAVDVAHMVIAECHMESRVLPYREVLKNLYDQAYAHGRKHGAREARDTYVDMLREAGDHCAASAIESMALDAESGGE